MLIASRFDALPIHAGRGIVLTEFTVQSRRATRSGFETRESMIAGMTL